MAEVKKAKFITSNTDYKLCPPPDKPEYAFIGRSNVGKSSLVNALCLQSKLAKTSAKPGKTQLINHFVINEAWYLVDLPGYGWAKVGRDKRSQFQKMTIDYLKNRENLMLVFVLIDSRLEPQAIDLEFLEALGYLQIPFALVFTKIDKQSVNVTNKNVQIFRTKMLETWEFLPEMFLSSAETGAGREEILGYIDELNPSFVKPN